MFTKSHLSKEAIKHMMFSVHEHTENVEDYINYKEAFNLAKTEISKSKRV